MNYELIEMACDPELRGDYDNDNIVSTYKIGVVPSLDIAYQIVAEGTFSGTFAKHAAFRYIATKAPCTFGTAHACLEHISSGHYYGKTKCVPFNTSLPSDYCGFEYHKLDRLKQPLRDATDAAWARIKADRQREYDARPSYNYSNHKAQVLCEREAIFAANKGPVAACWL